jgi:hypothetical protein
LESSVRLKAATTVSGTGKNAREFSPGPGGGAAFCDPAIGDYALVRFQKGGPEQWLLIKNRK